MELLFSQGLEASLDNPKSPGLLNKMKYDRYLEGLVESKLKSGTAYAYRVFWPRLSKKLYFHV